MRWGRLLLPLFFLSILSTYAAKNSQADVLEPFSLVSSSPDGAYRTALQRTGGKVLLIWTLDGRVTALRADNGVQLWSTELGGPLLHATQGEQDEQPLSHDSGNYPWKPSIIPVRDGSILINNEQGELTRLPFTAQELAETAPSSRGGTLLLASKSSLVAEVCLASGALLRTLRTSHNGTFGEESRGAHQGPTLWIGRSDYVVTAVGATTSKTMWNMSYSEIPPVDAFAASHADKFKPDDAAARGPEQPGDRFIFENEVMHHTVRKKPVFISLAATMSGELFATKASSGELLWQSEALHAPVVKIRSAYLAGDGRVILSEVPYTEVWPSLALPGPAPRQLAASDVFVGLLPTGQLYALPRSEATVVAQYGAADYAALTQYQRRGQMSVIAPGDVRLLPAPPSRGNDADADDSAVVEAYDPATCELPTEGVSKMQCFVGMRNVTDLPDSKRGDFQRREIPSPVWPRGMEPVVERRLLLGLATFLHAIPPLSLLHFDTVVEIVQYLQFGLFAMGITLSAAYIVHKWQQQASVRKGKRGGRGRGAQSPEVQVPHPSGSASLQEEVLRSPVAEPVEQQPVVVNGVTYKMVGKLGLSSQALGYGCHGTVVFRGLFDARPVAVKRLLRAFHPAASREISLLIRSDGHPNVVRYFAYEEASDFVYLALELCEGNLAEVMARCASMRVKSAAKRKKSSYEEVVVDVVKRRQQLALEVPVPSPATRAFLKELVAGVAHLHHHRIVHRDLKPHNILLARRTNPRTQGSDQMSMDALGRLYPDKEYHSLGIDYVPKISDFGLGKQLSNDSSSFGAGPASSVYNLPRHTAGEVSTSAAVPGSVGWQAPELIAAKVEQRSPSHLLPQIPELTENNDAQETKSMEVVASTVLADQEDRWRRSRSADIWSLACVMYFVIDAGNHPYGDVLERESNILHGRGDFSRIDHLPEAQALISSMLDRNPANRPSAAMILEHPFFWDDEKRLIFLQDVSDRLEHEPPDSPLLRQLERHAGAVIGAGWNKRLPPALVADMGKYRRYDFSSIVDCLRLLRNKRNHYRELPEHVRREIIGSDSPSALVPFFLAPARFPLLLHACYDLVTTFLAHEHHLNVHLGPHTTAVLSAKSESALRALMSQPAAALTREPTTPQASVPSTPQVNVQPKLLPSRGWYMGVEGWNQVFAAQAADVATRIGGPPVSATVELGGDSPMSASQETVIVVAAYERLKDTKFKGGAHVGHPRYKCTPCKDWDTNRGTFCPRGVRCDFAHGLIELRIRPEPRMMVREWAKDDEPPSRHNLDDLTLCAPVPPAFLPATDRPPRRPKDGVAGSM